jgi:hypothetical protein
VLRPVDTFMGRLDFTPRLAGGNGKGGAAHQLLARSIHTSREAATKVRDGTENPSPHGKIQALIALDDSC